MGQRPLIVQTGLQRSSRNTGVQLADLQIRQHGAEAVTLQRNLHRGCQPTERGPIINPLGTTEPRAQPGTQPLATVSGLQLGIKLTARQAKQRRPTGQGLLKRVTCAEINRRQRAVKLPLAIAADVRLMIELQTGRVGHLPAPDQPAILPLPVARERPALRFELCVLDPVDLGGKFAGGAR